MATSGARILLLAAPLYGASGASSPSLPVAVPSSTGRRCLASWCVSVDGSIRRPSDIRLGTISGLRSVPGPGLSLQHLEPGGHNPASGCVLDLVCRPGMREDRGPSHRGRPRFIPGTDARGLSALRGGGGAHLGCAVAPTPPARRRCRNIATRADDSRRYYARSALGDAPGRADDARPRQHEPSSCDSSARKPPVTHGARRWRS